MMYFLIFLVIAVLLAIPTWGISLAVFFIAKSKLDKKAMSVILARAVTSMRTECQEQLHHINRGAVTKLFDRLSRVSDNRHFANGSVTAYWGMIEHPQINGGQAFSLRVIYTARRGSSNTIYIEAAPGRNPQILSPGPLMMAGALAQ